MGKHERTESPEKPNEIIHMGARPTPDGTIETMVIVRLHDVTYQIAKLMSLDEYKVMLEGLDLCAKTAEHQSHVRTIQAYREKASQETGTPEDEHPPSTGVSTAPIQNRIMPIPIPAPTK